MPRPPACDRRRRVLVVACGALVREVRAVLAQLPGVDVEVEYLPAHLHNRPERITDAVCAVLDAAAGRYDHVAVAYGDCGTGGLLDAALRERGVSRLAGAHCYDFFAGTEVFRALHDAEPGTFYLTDYLVRHFDALVVAGLGLDRHPELRDLYFGHYRRVVHLAQSDSTDLRAAAEAAAARLGLEHELRPTGLTPFRSAFDTMLATA